MNRALLKQALDALEDSFDLVGYDFNSAVMNKDASRKAKKRVAESGARLTAHGKAMDALRAELAKPEGRLSNCDTCKHAWGSPANPGHCFMFYEEPQGVCTKHSEQNQRRSPTDVELVELVRDSKNCEGNRMLPVAFAREVEALVTGTRNCSRHPDAPHGFDRGASHSAGEYVCECQSWQPGEAS